MLTVGFMFVGCGFLPFSVRRVPLLALGFGFGFGSSMKKGLSLLELPVLLPKFYLHRNRHDHPEGHRRCCWLGDNFHLSGRAEVLRWMPFADKQR